MANPALGDRELCAALVKAGLADRFTTREVRPLLARCTWSAVADAVQRLWFDDLAERVIEGAGAWHYRLTAAGKALAAGGRKKPKAYDYREREESRERKTDRPVRRRSNRAG